MEYPEEVDVVVLGTGFVQAVIACAAARRGKSLFILDANEGYGESGASLGWDEFQTWGQQLPSRPDAVTASSDAGVETPAPDALDSLPSGVRAVPVPQATPDVTELKFEMHGGAKNMATRGFCIDLVHQAFESTGPCVQAMRDIGLHHSLEFAAVLSVFTWHEGRLYTTPSTKADVHAAPWLSLQDKRTLSLFLANAQLAAAGGLSELFQATHFKSALEDFGLHPSVQEGLLYSVFQAEAEVSRDTPVAGEAVLQAMVKYMSQAGAYVVGQAPYIESRYGCGDVAQAFIRQACVFGGAVALGTPVSHILVSDGAVCGVRTAAGHTIRCTTLFASPAYLRGFAESTDPGAGAPDADAESGQGQPPDVVAEEAAVEAEEARVRGSAMARGIVVLRRAVLPHLTNCQIVFPPGACGNEGAVSVWHCHHTLAVCPAPSVVLHLSMPHAGGEASLRALRACVAELLKIPDESAATPGPASAAGGGKDGPADACESDPVSEEDPILVECYYLQDLSAGDGLKLCRGAVCCPCPGRDWTLDTSLLLSERLFKKSFPDDVFLTKTPPVAAADEGGEDVDPLDVALKDLGLD